MHKACLPALSDHIWSHCASLLWTVSIYSFVIFVNLSCLWSSLSISWYHQSLPPGYVSLRSRHTEKRSFPVTQFCHAIFVDAFKPLETAGIPARLATCIRKTWVDSNNTVHMSVSKMWKAVLVSNQSICQQTTATYCKKLPSKVTRYNDIDNMCSLQTSRWANLRLPPATRMLSLGKRRECGKQRGFLHGGAATSAAWCPWNSWDWSVETCLSLNNVLTNRENQ